MKNVLKGTLTTFFTLDHELLKDQKSMHKTNLDSFFSITALSLRLSISQQKKPLTLVYFVVDAVRLM